MGDPIRIRTILHTQTSNLAHWTAFLGSPKKESLGWKIAARLGGISALLGALLYVAWRALFTMPHGDTNIIAAWVMIGFELLPLTSLLARFFTIWTIDGVATRELAAGDPHPSTVVVIPTYNEPVEVIGPTIAASVALEPAHATWVLDDGGREWVRDLCAAYGARYISREEHNHAKAGNINNALRIMEEEQQSFEVMAVLDCDHVPFKNFLTSTLGHFDDPKLALVQAPQEYYNAGAFDDDGYLGEQGVFFHVLMPSRNGPNVDPFWCGSTSFIRLTALREIGGVATETIVEDMHSSLRLIQHGWSALYHHQVIALGLAPDTPDAYFKQRRRWAMGAMQALVAEGFFKMKKHLSWRNYFEYLMATVWWLEGAATVVILLIPLVIVTFGFNTIKAPAETFFIIFFSTFSFRMAGALLLYRGRIKLGPALALRAYRILIGVQAFWWLLTRRELDFEVTNKGGSDTRSKGRAPGILWGIIGVLSLGIVYSVLCIAGVMHHHTSDESMVANSFWLILECLFVYSGIERITRDDFASTRRVAHRFTDTGAVVKINDSYGLLEDISFSGCKVLFRGSAPIETHVDLLLPGGAPVKLEQVWARDNVAAYRIGESDYTSLRNIALWLFHVPTGIVLEEVSVPWVAVRAQEKALGIVLREVPKLSPVPTVVESDPGCSSRHPMGVRFC